MPESTPPESESQRLFIAIALPAAVKAEIEKVQSELRGALSDATISWTRAENFHLTLRFLGKVKTDQIRELSVALETVCGRFQPLSLACAGMGVFPERRRPRVLWAGVNDDRDALPLLYQAINEVVAKFSSEPPEKRFTGHITLARIKEISRAESNTLRELNLLMNRHLFGSWTTEEILLMRSELGSQGARHSVICRAPLRRGLNR